jgi:DNA-binding LytR/AlgR family response regulator
MRRNLALLALVLAGATAGAVHAARAGPLRVCDGSAPNGAEPTFDDSSCPSVGVVDLDPQGRYLWVRQWVDPPPPQPINHRPPVLRLSAMAASEVYWNGRLIGRNGEPGATREEERPGRIDANFNIPEALVRPGPNLLAVRMSGHRGGLRVGRPVHAFFVAPGADTRHAELARYAPALVSLGVLLAAAFYFSALWWSQRRDRPSLLLASAALAGAVQLIAEVIRPLGAYPYPLHLVRMAVIVLSATVFGLLLAFTADRFAPDRRRGALWAAAAACVLAVVLTPGFDIKATVVVLLCAVLGAALALEGLRAGRTGARVALAGLAAFPLGVAVGAPLFLDLTYPIALATLVMLLFASEVIARRRDQHEREAARTRAARLELELLKRHLKRLVVNERGRRRLVDLGDIVMVKGADDYADLRLSDGTSCLHDESLTSLAARLPAPFLRVHRSIIVNLDQVQGVRRRSGGGHELALAGGTFVPIGRSYLKAVLGAVAGSE